MKRRYAGWPLLLWWLAAGAASIAHAQPVQKVYRIGYLSAPTRESVANGVDAFLRKLRDLGWVEGRNLEIEYRWAEGNVDRLPALAAELVSRDVDLMVPGISRVAFLGNPADPEWPLVLREIDDASRSLGIRLQVLEARGPEDFDHAFAAMAREHAGALLMPGGQTFIVHRARLAELALKARLPTMYSEAVESGGLMAYAINMADFVGRSAVYVDKT